MRNRQNTHGQQEQQQRQPLNEEQQQRQPLNDQQRQPEQIPQQRQLGTRTLSQKRARHAAYQREYRKRKRTMRIQIEQQQQNQPPNEQNQEQIEEQQQQQQVPQQEQLHPIEQIQVVNEEQIQLPQLPYQDFPHHYLAHEKFKIKFVQNPFGYMCSVCERLWFQNDLKPIPTICQDLIHDHFQNFNFEIGRVCSTCYSSLRLNKIPTFSISNGFKYPTRPVHLPFLDIVTERLISPRLPFMVIRRLRHGQGQYGILGQIINIPVNVNNMVQALPRNIDDDYAINVHIKRKQIHKSSYLMGMIKKSVVKIWLQYLINTPMFQFYNITIDNSFFNNNSSHLSTTANIDPDTISEVIAIEESLHAQQQTLLWNEDKYLSLAPAQNNTPISILFDEHCEELSFPSIYLGEFRKFAEGLNVTSFMIASSELRRADRRGVTPSHLLYMAMKIMRIRVRDSINIAFKHVGSNTNVTRADIENSNFLNGCIEKNLAFLKSIPNSVYYWSTRKRDLFAMMRQLGKPTFFLTMSANEIGWPNLMSLLYKLKHNGSDIYMTTLQNMHFNYKASLVNEDPVTCAIYFNKLVNTIMDILQSPQCSPFGNHYVKHYFKVIIKFTENLVLK